MTDRNEIQDQEWIQERASGRNAEFLKGVFFGVLLSGVFVMTAFLVLNGTLGGKSASGEEGAAVLTSRETIRKLAQIQDLIEDCFLYEADGEELSAYLFKGLAVGLDDVYANYYTAEELTGMEEAAKGAYQGIGISLLQDPDSGQMRVAGVYENSPAMEAGLRENDILLRVGDTDLSGMDTSDVAALIRSLEEAELTVERDGEELTVTVKLSSVEIPTVDSQMLEEGIGYLKISEFADVTVDQFEENLEELKAAGLEKLIVDVRGNPGGTLDSVCEILDDLLPEGLIVYTEDKTGFREEHMSDEERLFEGPLAVLVNENSASAAEIFAGAIQDYELGPVVGAVTYGKGVVQRTYRLEDGSALKLTTENYFTPSGQKIEGTGIQPDIPAEEPENGSGAEDGQEKSGADPQTDPQLQAAVDYLLEM